MSEQGAKNRWWENYLVRYLMPSIAGVVIVSWLSDIAPDGFRKLLFLTGREGNIDAPTLTLLFLYGNLFCYVASYPVLCFHATRVLDPGLPRLQWIRWLSGYAATVAMGAIALFVSTCVPPGHRKWSAFVIVILFSVLQCLRLGIALFKRLKLKGLDREVSPMFGFAYAIARRRGIPEEMRTRKNDKTINDEIAQFNDPNGDESIEKTQVIKWRTELIESYRHLREHGNSAFIFLLELILAALCFCVLSEENQIASRSLSTIGVLFAFWAIPSVVVHCAAQQLERRFSGFDRRISATGTNTLRRDRGGIDA